MPLLERQRIFHSRDAEETRAFLHGKEFRFEVAPRNTRQLDVHLNGVYLPNTYIGYLQYGSPVEIRATPARNEYWIQLPVRGHIDVAVGAKVVACGTSRAAIVSPGRDNLIRTEGSSARLCVNVSQAAIARQFAALLGEPFDSPLEFAPAIDLTAGYGQSLARYVLLAAADFEQAGSVCWNAVTTSLFEQFVMSTLLFSHPHNYTQTLQRLDRPIRPRDVKRAIEFMEAHLPSPITIADIAEASGIAGRTLFKHFQDFYGTSPMRYIRLARFRKVREALRAARDDQSVTEIAMSWGFSHMGRFSIEYRKLFGEQPSKTIRRRSA
jgi:AraC-like DNA-binding protein